ncbi:MAG TPA: hypothetical protein TECP_00946 [Hyphomicrobiaceae bacterium MAG_BT-2024]
MMFEKAYYLTAIYELRRFGLQSLLKVVLPKVVSKLQIGLTSC